MSRRWAGELKAVMMPSFISPPMPRSLALYVFLSAAALRFPLARRFLRNTSFSYDVEEEKEEGEERTPRPRLARIASKMSARACASRCTLVSDEYTCIDEYRWFDCRHNGRSDHSRNAHACTYVCTHTQRVYKTCT